MQARIFTKDLTDEEIDALAAVAVAGEDNCCCLEQGRRHVVKIIH